VMRFQRNGIAKADEQRRIARGLDAHSGLSLLQLRDNGRGLRYGPIVGLHAYHRNNGEAVQ
jgi:hypothetical protein